MWDLPGPGLEPVSPALAGGFLTTAPPGKPPPWVLMRITTMGKAWTAFTTELGVKASQSKLQNARC